MPWTSPGVQKKAALGRSKSKKFAEANRKRIQEYWDNLTSEQYIEICEKRQKHWTKKRREERSKKYTGSGNPCFGLSRPDFKRNRFRAPKGYHAGDLNPAKRPEVRAKMRKPHKMSREGLEVLARNGRKNLKNSWKHKRSVMMSGVMKSLSQRHKDFPYICKDGSKVNMMSSWEIRFAKVLDRLHVGWQYNEVFQRGPVHGILAILYTYKGKQHRYFPDFLIKSGFPYDLVEVKGKPITECDKVKLDAARKAGLSILLVDRQVLKFYEKNVKAA